MKRNFYALLLAILLPLAAISQTVNLTPDNAYQGQTLSITAVSSSPLSYSAQASNLYFEFYQQAGTNSSVLYPFQNPTLSGSNTLTANFAIPGTAIGWYNLFLAVDNYFTFNSVFYVNENLQGPGSVNGTVFQGTPKASSAPLAGLRLYFINSNGDTIAITRTAANGTFSFLHLPYGTYYLHAEGADNSNPIMYVIEPSNFNLSGVNVTYDPAANRLVNINEINLLEDNQLKLYPTVFSNNFDVTYTLKNASQVSIKVYDLNGGLVSTLVDANNTPAGAHNQRFNAAEANMHAAGLYLVKVTIGEGTAVLKVIKQ